MRAPSAARALEVALLDCYWSPAGEGDVWHPFWVQERYPSISTSGGSGGEGRSERWVRLSLDVEIDEIDR